MSVIRSFAYRRFISTLRMTPWLKSSQVAPISLSTTARSISTCITVIKNYDKDVILKEGTFHASSRLRQGATSPVQYLRGTDRGKIMTARDFCTVTTHKEPLIDVLDDYGIRTGESLSRKEIHELGKIHRAVHLYLFDSSGNLLLQRRSATKDNYPGMFCLSVTGHVDAGESSSAAMYREIQEELGLDPTNMNVQFLFSYRQDTTISATYINCQFNDVYACIHEDFRVDDIAFEKSEISELKLVPLLKFQEMVADEKSELAPVYAREWGDVLYFLDRP